MGARRQGIAIGFVGLCLVAVLAAAPAAIASGGMALHPAVPRPRVFDSGAAAVTAGALDREVLEDLRREGRAEAIVNFDGSGALAAARAELAARGLRGATAPGRLLAETVPAYEELKAGVFSETVVLDDYETLPAAHVRFESMPQLLRVLADPAVVSVRANRRLRTDLAQSLPLIRQPAADAAGYTGSGSAVAVLDTGVDYTRAAFGSCSAPGGSCKVAYAQDFATPDGQRDADGHGTNVAGIAVGVAPAAKILALDVFDGVYAYDSDIIEAINWTIQTRATYGTRAVNMSLGDVSWHTSECTGYTYSAPFSNLRAVGILPVVAAGNDAFPNGFRNGVSAPACVPGAVRVGAVYDANLGSMNWGDCVDNTTAADKPTCFSQTGSLLTLWAPGSQISAAGISYSGTSQAAPHVAGAVAVMGAANPSATAAQVQAALSSTGPSITDARNGVVRPRLDVAAAVAAVGGTAPPPTPSPSPQPSPSPGTYTTQTGGTLSGYSRISRGYALYRPGHDVFFTGALSPALQGELLGFEWQKRAPSGAWRTLVTASFAQDASGRVPVYVDGRDLALRARYRIRASYGGDGTYQPSTSPYRYFRVDS